jgi:lipid A ethanolaminephosphotransferase
MARNPVRGREWNSNQVLVAAAVFLTLFANGAFFRNIASAFTGLPWATAHLVSLGLFLLCATLLLLSLLTFRVVLKPVLTVLFLVSAATAYFMDSYNVIIDSDMIASVAATNVAESLDLVSPRLLIYLTLLGLLPSLLLWHIRITPVTVWRAARARFALVGAALSVMLFLALISSPFYASFVREHKPLRYYANPLTPIYAVYRHARRRLAAESLPLLAIGEDARIPERDVDRELVIMVVGETARADRFSLNGYTRETNPELKNSGVISFRDVSACGTSTAISVPCMFDVYEQSEFSVSKAKSTYNALDVLSQAGVSILWRDNNSDSKGVAERFAFENFRSPDINPVCDDECRDLGMLSGLQQYIEAIPAGDILVVLHQMGSHGPAYHKRYPPEFRVFVPTCDTSQLDNCTEAEIGNAYDNSILYTDYFLARVIDLLRSYDDRFETAMFYASDHGESLGESGIYLHGLPYWLAPDAQTRVPVVLWFGKNYDGVDHAAMGRLQDTPLSHDHVFHTLLGLFEIRSGIYEGGKDLLQMSRDLAGTPPEYEQLPGEH